MLLIRYSFSLIGPVVLIMSLQIQTTSKSTASWLIVRYLTGVCISVGKEGAFSFLLEGCVEGWLLSQASLAWVLSSWSQCQWGATDRQWWKDVTGRSCMWLKLHVALLVCCLLQSSSPLKRCLWMASSLLSPAGPSAAGGLLERAVRKVWC